MGVLNQVTCTMLEDFKFEYKKERCDAYTTEFKMDENFQGVVIRTPIEFSFIFISVMYAFQRSVSCFQFSNFHALRILPVFKPPIFFF